MKLSFNKLVASALILSMILSSLILSAYAIETSDAEQEDFAKEDLFISSELAEEIATLFVSDMIAAGTTSWTTSTNVLDINIMYDGTTERNVVAYAIELNVGYVVISAYVDVPNIILEWSDETAPLYEQFDLSENDDIVYGGSLYYYKDDGGNELETLDGLSVERDNVVNMIESTRDISNIPSAVKEILTNVDSGISTISSTPGSSSVITDPFTHASAWYNGPFTANDWKNYWETSGSTVECHRTSEYRDLGNGYVNHCGPTAITNLLVIYGNRFNEKSITNEDDEDIFLTVAKIGTSNLYYLNTNLLGMGGTANATANSYILAAFSAYGVSGVTVKGRYSINYTNVKNSLTNDRLLYLLLSNHDCYGDHHVVCYAYTRLVSSTDGSYVTYLKVADGWANSPRYIDIASVDGNKYWEVNY